MIIYPVPSSTIVLDTSKRRHISGELQPPAALRGGSATRRFAQECPESSAWPATPGHRDPHISLVVR